MEWVRCIRCKKFQNEFMSQTCALIAQVQPVLHRVSCSNQNIAKCTQTLRDAPKHEFMDQWGGSGPFIAKNSDAISWHELVY